MRERELSELLGREETSERERGREATKGERERLKEKKRVSATLNLIFRFFFFL